MRSLLALVLVLSGCGPDVEAYAFECQDGVFDVVRYTGPVDCNESRARTSLAAVVMEAAGLVDSARLKGWTLVVRAEPTWDSSSLGHVSGAAHWPAAVIEVGAEVDALAHEMIHAHLDMARELHSGWDSNGWWALGELYGWLVTGSVMGYSGPYAGWEAAPLAADAESGLRAAGFGPAIDLRQEVIDSIPK